MLVQQRLTEKQWTATVDKMIRWGAVMKDTDKPAVIAYLSKNFGRDEQIHAGEDAAGRLLKNRWREVLSFRPGYGT